MLANFVKIGRPAFLKRNLARIAHEVEEEYYEEKTNIKEQNREEQATTSQIIYKETIDGVVQALTAQRAKDVFVVRTENQTTPYNFKVICSTFNSRQASAISEGLRELIKTEGELPNAAAKASSRRSNGWYVSDIGEIQIHVMSEECREKYALEVLWAGDENLREQLEVDVDMDIIIPPSLKKE